ncbi:MAG: hypothetical protein HC923_09455 [Myxococcales bacterium]|nr:hypothetical protein [Myxococcales bacterium]
MRATVEGGLSILTPGLVHPWLGVQAVVGYASLRARGSVPTVGELGGSRVEHVSLGVDGGIELPLLLTPIVRLTGETGASLDWYQVTRSPGRAEGSNVQAGIYLAPRLAWVFDPFEVALRVGLRFVFVPLELSGLEEGTEEMNRFSGFFSIGFGRRF